MLAFKSLNDRVPSGEVLCSVVYSSDVNDIYIAVAESNFNRQMQVAVHAGISEFALDIKGILDSHLAHFP